MSSFVIVTLSVQFCNCYAECPVFLLLCEVSSFLTVILSVIMHSVFKLIVVMLIVVVPAHNNPDNHKQVVALLVTC